MKPIPLFDRYTLRPLSEQDTHAIFSAIDTQREYLGRWLPFVAATHCEEQTRAFVSSASEDPSNPVFTLRCDTQFAGLIGFKSADDNTRTIEIGYWLCAEFQGKGVMTTAVRTLCRMVYDELGMQQVEIRCAVGNTPSNRIPQRLGFRLDRVELRGEKLSDGQHTDLNVYVLKK